MATRAWMWFANFGHRLCLDMTWGGDRGVRFWPLIGWLCACTQFQFDSPLPSQACHSLRTTLSLSAYCGCLDLRGRVNCAAADIQTRRPYLSKETSTTSTVMTSLASADGSFAVLLASAELSAVTATALHDVYFFVHGHLRNAVYCRRTLHLRGPSSQCFFGGIF
jgi:hypothetical protein